MQGNWLLNIHARLRLPLILSLYPYDKALDPLIYTVAEQVNDPRNRVEVDHFHIRVIVKGVQVAEIRNTNRFYAWCSIGLVDGIGWDNTRPSAHAMYTLYRALKRRGQHKLPRK